MLEMRRAFQVGGQAWKYLMIVSVRGEKGNLNSEQAR